MKPLAPVPWMVYERMVPTGQHTDEEGRKWADFDLTVRLRWFRFFFPSYWRSSRWRFR